ncbi:MAG: ROK family protein [Stygiobacter sp.]|jgi:glucokinase|uniref:ROK family protein n=1 Tax=Stygiobacter electus TaxID=3032292 RepID=A0AAE3TBZ2_9BACT|nr:ROK family protein [Stygiobacter electus]MDF1611863.1 ROK family protein [Stygiobacter electus]
MKKSYIISVDLGGTKILSALIDNQNKIISRVKIETNKDEGGLGLVKSISSSILQLLNDNVVSENEVKAICLGVPGAVNPHIGLIEVAPNLGVENFNIKEELAKEISIPILVENDVNLAGLGIKKFELNDNVKNMLVIFIGTGIGSSLFFDGKIYRGSSYFAGEIGHIKVNAKGEISTNAKSLSFEQLASRTAIVKEIKKDLKKGKKSILKEFKSSKKTIKSKTLANAIKKNDPLAVKHVTNAAKIIGSVLGSITTLLNIDTIILGGGVIEAMHDFMLPIIEKNFNKTVIEACGRNVQIIETKLGDDAALFGGIALAEEFLS